MTTEAEQAVMIAASSWRHLYEVVIHDWWEISAGVKRLLEQEAFPVRTTAPDCSTCHKPITDDIRYLNAAGEQTHLICDPTSPREWTNCACGYITNLATCPSCGAQVDRSFGPADVDAGTDRNNTYCPRHGWISMPGCVGCGAVGDVPGDFYEEDEPVEKIRAAFEKGPHFMTGIPGHGSNQTVTMTCTKHGHEGCTECFPPVSVSVTPPGVYPRTEPYSGIVFDALDAAIRDALVYEDPAQKLVLAQVDDRTEVHESDVISMVGAVRRAVDAVFSADPDEAVPTATSDKPRQRPIGEDFYRDPNGKLVYRWNEDRLVVCPDEAAHGSASGDDRCPSNFTDRSDHHKLFECHLAAGHGGEHYGCDGAVWTDELSVPSNVTASLGGGDDA